MAQVFLNVSGDGTAYTDAVPPLVNGETFTIYCIPYDGATLEDVRVWTSYDEAIAIAVSEEITLTYKSAWGNVYVEVYFSGAPEPPSVVVKFPWLFKQKEFWRMKL